MEQPMPTSCAQDQKQLHDAYGEHVAEKLRSLPPSMVPFCQKLINEAIFQAEFGQLNFTSKIVTYNTHSAPTGRQATNSKATDCDPYMG